MFQSITILTAQADSRLEIFSDGFRKNRAQFDSGDVTIFVAGLTAAIAILWLLARWSERHVRTDSSLRLFWKLARAHDIPWADRWLLWRIARAKGVAEPAILFLDPRLTSPQSTYHLAPQSAARLKKLRRTLFSGIGEMADAPAEISPASVQAPCSSTEPVRTASWQSSLLEPTGDLADALNAIRTLCLQDRPVRQPEPKQEAPVDHVDQEEEVPPARTADLPAAEAPVLDLYPWLSGEWEITDNK